MHAVYLILSYEFIVRIDACFADLFFVYAALRLGSKGGVRFLKIFSF